MFNVHFWSFILRTRKFTMFLVATFIISAIILFLFYPAKAKVISKQWDNMQLWLSTFTLFVACAVWVSEARQEWGDDLAKRLSVDFKLVVNGQDNGKQGKNKNDRLIMCCKRAKLIGEGDIRALAQQIGRQMINNKDLKMIPMLDEVSDNIDKRRKEKHYQVTVRLTSMPDCLASMADDKILLWEDDFTVLPRLASVRRSTC